MSNINNFDTSSTGVNIELNVRYDEDLGHFYFEDAKDGGCGYIMETYGMTRSGSNLAVFYANEEEKDEPYYTISALQRTKRKDLEELASDFIYDCDKNSYETKGELIDEMMHVITKDAFYKNLAAEWLKIDCEDFVAHGYSQGDAIKVIVTKPCKKDNKFITRKFVERLFFDTPVHASLEVETFENGEKVSLELSTCELLEDIYEYDADTLKENALEEVETHFKALTNFDNVLNVVKEFLDDYTPDRPTY